MPPKAKFTKKEIVQAALEIVRADGISSLTARALGLKLGSSSRPIFTVFTSMDEVLQEVEEAAKILYREYIQRGLQDTPAFKGVGTEYIMFSVKEPKLFQLLFMREKEQVPDLANVLPLIDDNYEAILLSIKNGYGVSDDIAKNLYQHLWIYTHGIATLFATKMCRLTGDQINKMISEVFISLLKTMKG
jgi:AcrR family transcriptional regulator